MRCRRNAQRWSEWVTYGGLPILDVVARLDRAIQYSRATGIQSRRLWDTGCPACAEHDTGEHGFAFPRHKLPGFCIMHAPSKERGRREGRALAAPAASCAVVESTRV